jgi:hypothetical protein
MEDTTVVENVKDQPVVADNPLKELFVQYVGEKLQPEDGNVTVDMIVSVLADEFPEFVLVMAEENFIQGYKQAFADVESWNKQQLEGGGETTQNPAD